jgi:glutamate-1-semialdehyde 2,1-aminomutase
MYIGLEHSGVTTFFDKKGNRIVFSHGKDGFVYDTFNERYYDFILGYGPVIIGHNNDRFNKLLFSFLKYGIHLPSYSIFHYQYGNELFDSLLSSISYSYFKTASEAITAAIRLSTEITGKFQILRCGYIGWHDAQLSDSVSWLENIMSNKRFEIRFKEGFRGVKDSERVLNWNNFDLQNLDNFLSNNTISCFIFDMFQLSYCGIDTLKKAIEILRNHNVAIILDETKTGGRISELGYTIDNNIDYDMVILGKSLANGAPISILFGKKDIMIYAKKARIGGTFSKELLSIYSALATQKIMRDIDGFNMLKDIGNQLCLSFDNIATDLKISDYVRLTPLFGGSIIDVRYHDSVINKYELRKQLGQIFINNGILLLQGHPSFVCLSHSLIFNSNLEDSIYQSLKEWKIYLEQSN